MHSKGKTNDILTFTTAVTTSQGQHWVFKVTNPTAYVAFGQSNLSGDITSLEQDFVNYADFGLKYLQLSVNDAREFAFLRTFKNVGILMYKGNSNFTSWQERTLTNND